MSMTNGARTCTLWHRRGHYGRLPQKSCLVGEDGGGEHCYAFCTFVLAPTQPPRGTNTLHRHVLSEPPSSLCLSPVDSLLHGRGETSHKPPRHGLPLPSLLFLAYAFPPIDHGRRPCISVYNPRHHFLLRQPPHSIHLPSLARAPPLSRSQ